MKNSKNGSRNEDGVPKKRGVKTVALKTDVSKKEDVKRMVRETVG